MWLMLQQDTPDDYIVATGRTHRLEEFVEHAFAQVGLDWHDHVVSDPGLARPNELRISRADPTKTARQLGWTAKHAMPDVVRLMVEHEMKGGYG
jgi:GDPmannose 4,6-dehydratase